MRARTLLAVGVLGTTLAAPALAADPAAEALFVEAKRLMQNDDWASACPKLEESQRVDPAIGTEFNLADCNEHVGKTATAWAQFLDVAAVAKLAGQPARERAARARAKALEPVLSRLTIQVHTSDPGLQVFRDGVEIGKAQWMSPIPVDPGDHEIRATAPGKETWRSLVRVAAQGTASVEVQALEDLAKPDPVPAQAAVEAPAPTEWPPATARAERQEDRGSGRRTAGALTAAAGVIGLGAGAVFGVISKGKHDDAASHCTGGVCDAAGVADRDDARRAGNEATVAFILGGAAVMGGAVLWFTAPRGPDREKRSARLLAVPLASRSAGGLFLTGAW